MGASNIDRIVVREGHSRLAQRARTMEVGVNAANALLWFKEYADKKEVEKVVSVDPKLVASSTPNAGAAQRYVTAAAAKFAQQIMDEAIMRAERDFSIAHDQARRAVAAHPSEQRLLRD